MSVLRREIGDNSGRGRNRFFRGHLLHASHLVLSQLVAGHYDMQQGQGIGICSYIIHNQAAASVSAMGMIPQSLTTLFRLVLTLPSLLPNFSSCFTISIPSTTSPKTTCFPLLVSMCHEVSQRRDEQERGNREEKDRRGFTSTNHTDPPG